MLRTRDALLHFFSLVQEIGRCRARARSGHIFVAGAICHLSSCFVSWTRQSKTVIFFNIQVDLFFTFPGNLTLGNVPACPPYKSYHASWPKINYPGYTLRELQKKYSLNYSQ